MDTISLIEKNKVVAILRLSFTPEKKNLVGAIQALVDGGVSVLEIATNTPKSLQLIELVKQEFPGITIGAGTILDPESAKSAISSGANFLLAPTLKKETIEIGNRYGIPVIPGILSPTEALTAYEAGAQMVKVFPASTVGASYIKNINGPLPQIKVMAVGGVNLNNSVEFLESGCSSIGIGSSLISDKVIIEENYSYLRGQTAKLIERIRSSM